MMMKRALFFAVLISTTLSISTVLADDAELLDAVRNNDADTVGTIVQDGSADVNVRDSSNNGATGVILAAKSGSLEVLQLLIGAGANVNLVDTLGNSALHYAVKLGGADVVKVLLDSKANVNLPNRKECNQTPLMACFLPAATGNECSGAIVVALMNNSASTAAIDCKKKSALDTAKNTTNQELYLSLLGACIATYNGECVLALVEGQQLITRGIDTLSQPVVGFYRDDDTVLSVAARTSQRLMAQILLEQGANPDKPPGLLGLAARTGELEFVQLLVNFGVSLDAVSQPDCSRTAIMICAMANGLDNQCSVDIFNFLLAKRASLVDVDCTQKTVYQLAEANTRNPTFLARLQVVRTSGYSAIQANARPPTGPAAEATRSGGSLIPTAECGFLPDSSNSASVSTTTRSATRGGSTTRRSVIFGRTTNGQEVWLPWMARLVVWFVGAKAKFCGGSIISSNWILTAAHCVREEGAELLSVEITVGNHNYTLIEAGQIKRPAAKPVIVHPNYSLETKEYDFALLRLISPIERFTKNIQPICLPDHPTEMCDASLDINDDTATQIDRCSQVFAAGWGLDETGNLTPVLKKVDLKVMSYPDCKAKMELPISDVHICAGSQNGQSTCQGDSGGPLMCAVGTNARDRRYFAIGVVSWGKEECGQIGIPTVFSRVCKVLPWIKNVTNFNFANGNAVDNGRVTG